MRPDFRNDGLEALIIAIQALEARHEGDGVEEIAEMYALRLQISDTGTMPYIVRDTTVIMSHSYSMQELRKWLLFVICQHFGERPLTFPFLQVN